MGWKLRIAVIGVIVVFVCGCAWLGFAVYARYQSNEYVMHVTAAFNAAALLNGDETFTQPDKAVISAFEGRRYVVIPENYKAIVSLLRKDCAMPLFSRVGKDAPLSIAICASDTIDIKPCGNGVDEALIRFVNGSGKRFTMHVRGGNIWKQLIEYATTGRSERRNLPI